MRMENKKNMSDQRTHITLELHGVLAAHNLRGVPGIATDSLQPVQVILVEDL